MRRLGAQLYDCLLLLAVWFLATALVLPLNQGHAFEYGQWLYSMYLLLVSFVFYAWFWTHGGQTLGMRAWKIRLETEDAQSINWKQSAVRFLASGLSWLVVGMGFWWCLFDRQRLSWHDRLSGTRLIWLASENHGQAD